MEYCFAYDYKFTSNYSLFFLVLIVNLNKPPWWCDVYLRSISWCEPVARTQKKVKTEDIYLL
jgi:hypothetical protein